MEYQGACESAAMQAVQDKVRRNTEIVLAAAGEKQIPPRRAAEELALERIGKAMSFKRWSIY
jgi:glutamate dehydrogenase (NAD(P)+)